MTDFNNFAAQARDEKTCGTCKITKPISEFHITSNIRGKGWRGHHSSCKKCRSLHSRAWHASRAKQDRPRQQAYWHSDHGHAISRENSKRQYIKHREKHLANHTLNNAVAAGRIIKPKVCSKCLAEPNRIHGHHPDYSKPLEVIWLCAPCHRAIHMEINYAKAA